MGMLFAPSIEGNFASCWNSHCTIGLHLCHVQIGAFVNFTPSLPTYMVNVKLLFRSHHTVQPEILPGLVGFQ